MCCVALTQLFMIETNYAQSECLLFHIDIASRYSAMHLKSQCVNLCVTKQEPWAPVEEQLARLIVSKKTGTAPAT